jgi:hypothetical protein
VTFPTPQTARARPGKVELSVSSSQQQSEEGESNDFYLFASRAASL